MIKKLIIEYEMKKGVNINNDKIDYIGHLDNGVFKYESNFTLRFEDIILIGVFNTLIIDDEVYFLVLVDKNKAIYSISDFDLDFDKHKLFLDRFNISKNDLIHSTWKEHKNNKNYILYPIELKGNKLFKSINFISRSLKTIKALFKLDHIAKGEFSEACNIFFNNRHNNRRMNK